MKAKNKGTAAKLYFLQDLSLGDKTVYSGHIGLGKKLQIFQSDYGKYAMEPTTMSKCEALKLKIEKAAKGALTFKWNIIPITDIDLCNFYSDDDYSAFKKLQEAQHKLI